jgi:hypothetical protein
MGLVACRTTRPGLTLRSVKGTTSSENLTLMGLDLPIAPDQSIAPA